MHLHYRLKGRRPGADTRTWKDRRGRELHAWDKYIDRLTDSYMTWKFSNKEPVSACVPSLTGEKYPYSLTVFDIFTMEEELTVYRPETSDCPAIDFALNGYMTKTPVKPEVAIGFRTLELFHRLRLRKPSLSIEAFTKVICDYYEVNFAVSPDLMLYFS